MHPRHLLLTATVTVLLVACGAEGQQDIQTRARDVPISTSSWKPGDAGLQALRSGPLSFTRRHCPVVRGPVVWPAGYSSEIEPDGDQVVLTADGQTIRAGDIVTAGGGSVPRRSGGTTHRRPCTPRKGDVFVIMSTVTVTPRHP